MTHYDPCLLCLFIYMCVCVCLFPYPVSVFPLASMLSWVAIRITEPDHVDYEIHNVQVGPSRPILPGRCVTPDPGFWELRPQAYPTRFHVRDLWQTRRRQRLVREDVRVQTNSRPTPLNCQDSVQGEDGGRGQSRKWDRIIFQIRRI